MSLFICFCSKDYSRVKNVSYVLHNSYFSIKLYHCFYLPEIILGDLAQLYFRTAYGGTTQKHI